MLILSSGVYVCSMEYEHLARGLKTALLKDPHALDAANLANVSSATLSSWFHPFTPPQLEERKRKVKELGDVLLHIFDGKALNLIKQANGSAVEAVRLVLSYFPGFRDHAVYKGEQVHFYKRAQILVGDVWAAYGRRSTGVASFHDIAKLTMFGTYLPEHYVATGCVYPLSHSLMLLFACSRLSRAASSAS